MSPQNSTQVGPPRPRGGLWDYLSPSRLNTWLSCPLKFRFRYVDRIPSASTPSLLLGKVVHAGLEALYRGRQEGALLEPGELVGRVRDCFSELAAEENLPFADAGQEEALRQQAVDLVLAYEGQLAEEEPRPLAIEQTFSAPLVDPDTGEHVGLDLLGVVDLVLDPASPVIVDFKTAARSGQANSILHEVQLSSYAYLFRDWSGRPEAGLEIRSLIKTRTPLVQIHRYRPRQAAEFRRLFAAVRAYLEDLTRGSFVYRPGFSCSFCPYRETECRSWAG